MPSTLIEVRKRYNAAQETALIDAVQDALVAGFKIPAGDKDIRLAVHEPHRLAGPPNLSQPEQFTRVTIDAFAGRSLEAKRNLYRGVVDRLERLGIPRDCVTILLREAPRENWGIRGGQAACDVELGFEVKV